MKRIYYIFASLLCLWSCSLTEIPYSNVTRDNFYRTPQQCKAALRALYTPVHYIYCEGFLYATEACTDIWGTWGNNDNARLLITPANPGVGTTVWRYAYIGIMRANECIDCISASDIAEDEKMPFIAEARTMRALYYYILTCFFGDVPYYDYAVSDLDTMEQIRALGRTDATHIREELYRDLKENALPYFTEGNGLRARTSDIRDGHAGFALAAMLMAKMAMWNHAWDDALYALNEIEAVYGDIAAYPLEEIQWRYKDTAEGIFEIRHDWSENGVKFYGSVANVLGPWFENGSYNGVTLPDMAVTTTSRRVLESSKHYALYRSNGRKAEENAANAKAVFPTLPLKFSEQIYNNTRYYTDLDIDAIATGVTETGRSVDYRVVYKLGLGNLANGDTFKWTRTENRGFGGPQFWCPGMTKTYDSNNYRIFRYADAVLMKAECLYRNGLYDQAVAYVNKVRRRAYTNPATGAAGVGWNYEFTDADALLQEIMDERARELGGEFQRKFDMVRWGNWVELTSKYSEISHVKNNIRPYHVYYPIPDTECALSQGALNNDAYSEQVGETEE
ncbi:MAG: RagB/SusD family nutrient uptake outer membrane protein [Candidatus Cryptobacteroides sp.]